MWLIFSPSIPFCLIFLLKIVCIMNTVLQNLAIILVTMFFALPAIAELISPYDVEYYRDKWSSYANVSAYQGCPTPEDPVVDLNADSIYMDVDDGCRCTVDPVKEEAYLSAISVTRGFSKTVVKLADQYATTLTADPQIAACTLKHLDSWASSYALMGNVSGSAGRSTVTNVLVPASQAFLKIRNAEGLDSEKLQRVQIWMKNLARQQVIYQTYNAGPNTQKNNHRYWDAFAVVGAAIASNDEDLFLWANESLNVGLEQIIQKDRHDEHGVLEPSGALPLELARGSFSHKYHVYALSPLVGLSEAIHVNRSHYQLVSPYVRYNKALYKLVDLIVAEENRIRESSGSGLLGNGEILACHQTAWAEVFLRRNARLSKYENAPALAELIGDKREDPACKGRLYFTGLGGFTTYSFGLVGLQKIIDGLP